MFLWVVAVSERMADNPISHQSDGTAPSLEEFQQIYDQRSHIPAKFRDMSWSSWFRINSRMVNGLQVGRVFLWVAILPTFIVRLARRE